MHAMQLFKPVSISTRVLLHVVFLEKIARMYN